MEVLKVATEPSHRCSGLNGQMRRCAEPGVVDVAGGWWCVGHAEEGRERQNALRRACAPVDAGVMAHATGRLVRGAGL